MDTFSPKRLRAAAASWRPLPASPWHRRAPTPHAAFTSQVMLPLSGSGFSPWRHHHCSVLSPTPARCSTKRLHHEQQQNAWWVSTSCLGASPPYSFLADRRTQQQALTPMAPATSSHGIAPSQGELLLILTLCSLSIFADHQLKLQLWLTSLPLLQQRQMFDETPRRPCSEDPLFFTLCAAS
ncbi:hypothetical protein U9M48_043422 [Paspalum notatum var. saurae]|uniref:Uncharacterized protein n=1 Tax=Paspalum notatum var. saurae TaxID=547442 RepID=A0AAQ3USZ5_PASNO